MYTLIHESKTKPPSIHTTCRSVLDFLAAEASAFLVPVSHVSLRVDCSIPNVRRIRYMEGLVRRRG